MEQGPADVGDGMAWQRAQKGFERIDRLDAACEAEAPKLPADDAGLVLDRLAAFAHQDENGCVITEHDKVRACIGDSVFGLVRHPNGVLVDHAALRLEHLRKEAPGPLLPFAMAGAQNPQGFMSIERNEALGKTELDR